MLMKPMEPIVPSATASPASEPPPGFEPSPSPSPASASGFAPSPSPPLAPGFELAPEPAPAPRPPQPQPLLPFRPVAYLPSVTHISPQALVEQGYLAVLLDIDNTLVPRDTRLLSEEVAAWVASLRQAGLKVCLLSNNWHRTVFAYARRLKVPIVYKAMKPLPFAYLRALGKLGLRRAPRELCEAVETGGLSKKAISPAPAAPTTPAAPAPAPAASDADVAPAAPTTPAAPAPAPAAVGKIAVIGDQLLTDVLGARLLGLLPILVKPQSTTDLWYTQLFRRVEHLLLRGMHPQK